MIEKKFKSLVDSFLRGEISSAETAWMAEDLHHRRERRDLFIERIEDYLDLFLRLADPVDERLRQLLLKDLSHVDVRDIERAMPRQRNQIPAREIEEWRGGEPRGGGRGFPPRIWGFPPVPSSGISLSMRKTSAIRSPPSRRIGRRIPPRPREGSFGGIPLWRKTSDSQGGSFLCSASFGDFDHFRHIFLYGAVFLSRA